MNKTVPSTTFKTRKEIDTTPGFVWEDLTYDDIFKDKRVVIFALPGAWTPTCSSTHLPMYEAMYDDLRAFGVDEIYCLSVNDSFTMNAWFNHLNVKNVKPLPDGNGEFTEKMEMIVSKENLGFGKRSWRYSMVVNNGEIECVFEEDGKMDNSENDPFLVSSAPTMMEYLSSE